MTGDEEDEMPESVELPIEDVLDLHAFAPRDVPSLVKEWLEACLEKGFAEVRIIHGKGRGELRRTVHALLQKHHAVESFRQADANWGATVVTLGKAAK